jgi:hypothetical protein
MSTFGLRLGRLSLAVLASVSALAFVGVSSALAQGPWWQIGSETVPTNLPPGGTGQLLVVLSNLGDAPIEGGKSPVVFKDTLPPGLEATEITGGSKNNSQVECTRATLECRFEGELNPYEQITVTIKVKVASAAAGTLLDRASVEGGGAAGRAEPALAVPVSGEPAGYGVAGYEMAPFNEGGTPARQAGAHPFELTSTLVLNQTAGRQPVALPKDLLFQLPPGLVGDTNAVSQCTMANFFALVKEANLCPASSVVGVASVVAFEPLIKLIGVTVPVFNLVPAQGEPARLGFEVVGKIPVVIDTSVRSGRDYGVDASVKDATETGGILRSQLTIWGAPGDPAHNNARGWECVAGGKFANEVEKTCPATSQEPDAPFLTLPTSCAANPQSEPVRLPMETDSWTQPGSFLGAEYAWMNEEGQLLGFEGCSKLPFTPKIDVSPEEHSAATPTGLEVRVRVPQEEGLLEAGGRAQADVRDTTVTLPRGVELSPAAANGLEGCSEAQVGFEGFDKATQTDEFDTAKPTCPDGSKVGTVRIKTPLLSHELEGAVYLASPAANGEAGRNPFNSLVALYLVAEDPVSGVLVKLAGEGQLNEETLEISTSFKNAPQVPFEELGLHLFGGPGASLSTPSLCGAYATSATFTPWSGTPAVSVLSPAEDFWIASGVGGSACPSGSSFAPGFLAAGGDRQAGAFTSFGLELSRPDGDQALSAVRMHLPPGIAALLSSVQLCSDAQAAASACPPGSEVGQAIAIAGLGSEPYVQKGGRVFITGPYGDAPFGLEIVTPAKAGPFDLGYVTVRSKLYIDPSNASVTIVSNPLPTQIRGIPLQLKRVIVNVDRPGFEFNPTSCAPMRIEGTVTGAAGGSAGVSDPFQVENCQGLPFSPQLTASAAGHGSKAEGTSFAVTVRSGGVEPNGVAQAGIAKVDLQLPKQLSSRLPTLQKACLEAVFNANPASCDEGSVIGYATIHTPVLKNPLSGPAYLVSHGNAAFPDVEFVLQGEGITLILDGKTDIKEGITYSRFESTPDAPFTIFETVLPAGPHGVLTPNVPEAKQFSLCGERLEMPTTITGQNGAPLEQDTKVAISGCGEVQSARAHKLTLMQRLKRALVTCRHRYKHSTSRRERCERQAHVRYTRLALAACRHEHKQAKRKACVRAARRRFGARHAHRAAAAAGKRGGAGGGRGQP